MEQNVEKKLKNLLELQEIDSKIFEIMENQYGIKLKVFKSLFPEA